jgi:hypothetical protein
MVSVVSSPTRVYIKIKTWDIVIITPAPVIIMRAIPTSFPRTPPPAIPEKDVHVYVRDNVDIRLRQHYHSRRCLKYDGWWQSNTDVYIYPCFTLNCRSC